MQKLISASRFCLKKLHTICNASRIMYIREFSLTPHVIIKEEQATVSCPPAGTGSGACRRWERNTNASTPNRTRHLCPRHGRFWTTHTQTRVPNRLRRCHIPKRINCISRFESKSFLKNILESNAGGRGCPRRKRPPDPALQEPTCSRIGDSPSLTRRPNLVNSKGTPP